jgi:hypothetical protein
MFATISQALFDVRNLEHWHRTERAASYPPPAPSRRGRGLGKSSPLAGEGRERGVRLLPRLTTGTTRSTTIYERFPGPLPLLRSCDEREAIVILDFQSNHLTTVEKIEPTFWRIAARSDDNLFSGEVLLDVKLPALDILHVRLSVKRDVLGATRDFLVAEEKLVGVRVGPGMTKIVRGLVGGHEGSERMAELVLEAMEMLVNALTAPELRKAMSIGGKPFRGDATESSVPLNDVVIGEETVRLMAANPRLKDSCAAFLDL